MSVAKIQEQILELSPDEKWELSDWFASQLPDFDEQEEASLRLAHQRMTELEAGTKRLIPEKEVWKEIDAMKLTKA